MGQQLSDWIEWKGGECPVDPEIIVQARRRNERGDGSQYTRIKWAAGRLDWQHASRRNDITAYRVIA